MNKSSDKWTMTMGNDAGIPSTDDMVGISCVWSTPHITDIAIFQIAITVRYTGRREFSHYGIPIRDWHKALFILAQFLDTGELTDFWINGSFCC